LETLGEPEKGNCVMFRNQMTVPAKLLSVAVFMLLDVSIYFLVYMFSAYFVEQVDFGLAWYTSVLWLSWRAVKLQIFVEIYFLISQCFGKGALGTISITAILIISYLVGAFFSWSGGEIFWALFLPQNVGNLGPGLALVISQLTAFFICRAYFSNFGR